MTPTRQASPHASKYEKLGIWEPLTLGEQLENWSQAHHDSVALVEEGLSLTYGELNRKTDELAAGFAEMGITRGDNVAIQLPNRISFAVVCFALFRLGARPVLCMPAHREAELNGIFKAATPVAYVIPDRYLGFDYCQLAAQLARKHPQLKSVIVDGKAAQFQALDTLFQTPRSLKPPHYRDTALFLLSGGTTGIPKLIPRTHTDYAFNAKASALRCGVNANSTYLAVLPVAHNFPLACPGMLGTLSQGGRVVFSATTGPDEALPLIEREGVTITALVPALANLWRQVLEWDGSDISSLELMQIGGSPLDETLARQIMPEFNCRLQQVFGMAEGLVCYTGLDDPEGIILTSQGRPLSEEDQVKIVDADGKEVAQGEYGELWVKGPYTIHGYYNAPEINAESFSQDGYYQSGDTARITPEGNIQVGGRIKEQINRAGEKIMAAEIESCLCTIPDIIDAAVVGLPDPELGEQSCAFVIADPDAVSLSSVHAFFRQKGMARFKMPDQVFCLENWPLTSVGKINKQALIKLASPEQTPRKSVSRPPQIIYKEKQIPFDGDPLIQASEIIRANPFNTHFLYENESSWSLGLGIHAMITVTPDTVTLKTSDDEKTFPFLDFPAAMDRVFQHIDIPGFRAYGTANFGLARRLHGLDPAQEGNELMTLIIPRAEVCISKTQIHLRALEPGHLKRLETLTRDNQHPHTDQTRLNHSELSAIFQHHADAYRKIVSEAVEQIQSAQYQKVILSRHIPLGEKLDMGASYVQGRRANSPARSFYFKFNGLEAAGFSPETVIEANQDGWISTQPLAGTRALGASAEEELRLKAELLADTKEIAEHAVSIKLAYEELETVCSKESIAVSDFMGVARRGKVQHLASRLKGRLKPELTCWHGFAALFPGVTASGIPKKEAIQAIGALESHPRSLYSGCTMTVDSHGNMDAALVLRTFFQNERKSWLQAGAGIVSLSMPDRELEETCEKLSSVSHHLVEQD
ncbi:MAG: salicylate synthase [Desulfobacterales bacterium]|nr:salicylate synthase [Desulfobacterales bacterium]